MYHVTLVVQKLREMRLPNLQFGVNRATVYSLGCGRFECTTCGKRKNPLQMKITVLIY